MRIVAVSVVKNEADIIEAFVRHTSAWVDHHLILDHDSTDGTREILAALAREGLRISLFGDTVLANLQQARSQALSQRAFADFSADWVMPLDADEFIAGPGNLALAQALAAMPPGQPAELFLVNYTPTADDDSTRSNPVERLTHLSAIPSQTKKILLPRTLGLEPDVQAGKGSHALFRHGQALPGSALPGEFYLAHFALRSPEHHVLRVVLAELQKLSRGHAHAGLDHHYRLGYQLLKENPAFFFSTLQQPSAGLVKQPLPYRGGPLRYSQSAQGWSRVATALLPFLEKLAVSHGELRDRLAPADRAEAIDTPDIRALDLAAMAPLETAAEANRFTGFEPGEGWGPLEGPVPEAYLPAFHWSLAPHTALTVRSATPRDAMLVAEALTYCDQQIVGFELNGVFLRQHHFAQPNQKETIRVPLRLRAGENTVLLRYAQAHVTPADSRLLAAIYLSLRIA